MLHTLKGNVFDCLFTLVSIKLEHPRPLQVCTNVCIIFAHTGAGVIRVAHNSHKSDARRKRFLNPPSFTYWVGIITVKGFSMAANDFNG